MPLPQHPALASFGTTIFAEMTGLAQEHDAVNLGQGFRDEDGPGEMLEAAARAIHEGANQYPPAAGLPVLREAIAEHQRRWYGLDLDPTDQVQVTVGATEAVAVCLLTLVRPGDEVVVIEPAYDSYAACIALAGGVARPVTLRFPDFRLDPQELRAAFTSRTRVVLVNSPHNPTGRVLDTTELQAIADLAQEHDAWVVSDEVYEHLTFDGVDHVPITTLPGMARRTITISSAGKTFSATGWKVGWLTGPPDAVAGIRQVKQFLTFAHAAPFQLGVAAALALPDERVQEVASRLQRRRDLLVTGLRDAGLPVSMPAGTYFVVADLAPLGWRDAARDARTMAQDLGVVGIPVAVFHSDDHEARTLARFAFCKQEPVLQEAVRRLTRRGPGARELLPAQG
ncbi:aminotransferase class I/II-fold pyridoxal phosphate-dependent enzyme [Arsenicicoccus dermatophilus]|uniref:aminotransferase class I/II-fold pyridoxal phosphate-dependent enzyme n=1 Tax=Arsenicicoccus dermatophilus TaxID=1076331 RepID=UPI001F4CA1D0|nr:aminotransferase class I/II-fold pyridoxal phosphate-dependent enzyme [Arsenicicoccus dermatophilus]MCH8612891.1 aminotransferase class I/II-fold pyridoxal phosphate-dependent enzyme [Arsenicicoccus dermatophilus]